MKLALLNTTIATTDGVYKIETISLPMAQAIFMAYFTVSGIDSAVGHDSTAVIMSTLLGARIPVNRQMFEQQKGQQALVFKLKGRVAEINQIGYEFKLMTRVS